MAILTDIAPAPTAFRGENATRAHALRRGGDHQPRLLHPLAGLRARLAARRGDLRPLRRRRHRLRPLRQGAAGGDRRDPPDLLDQARRSSSPRRSSPTCSPAAPISFDFPELQRFNFEGGGFIDKSLIALWLALGFYTASYIAESVRAGILAVSRGQSEAAAALGHPAQPDHEPRGAAAGAPGHHPAPDLAVPQPHQELLARHRRRLHGRPRRPSAASP